LAKEWKLKTSRARNSTLRKLEKFNQSSGHGTCVKSCHMQSDVFPISTFLSLWA
jgi:hypothetical protein